MKTLIIILGLILLSGTNAWAANLRTRDEARQARDDFSLSSYIPTQRTPNQADGYHNTLPQESGSKLVILKGKLQLIRAGFDDPGRGNPDQRGEGGKGGGSR